MDINKIDKDLVWHPFTSLHNPPVLPVIVKAKGVILYTQSGEKIIDAISSWWVNLHGHGNKTIAKAIYTQAKRLDHVIFAGFTHWPAVSLVDQLSKFLPYLSKFFFSDNGSTAVEVAIKMAIQYWHNLGIKKETIIAIKGGYHGDTFGSMSVAERGPFTSAFNTYLFHVDFIDFPEKNNHHEVIRQFREIVEKNNTAAFIFEPLVQGASGMRIYQVGLLNELLDIAKKHNVVCIADEVMTGFGRTGRLFASDYLTTKPDIMCLSKGITGGCLPLGITACSERIVKAFEVPDTLKTFFHGHSYTANSISCAAALASFKILTSKKTTENIKRITFQHEKFIKLISSHPKIKNCRSLGTILAIELETDQETSYFNKERNNIYSYFLKKHILLRPLGNVIYILPPYIIRDKHLNKIYKAIISFLE